MNCIRKSLRYLGQPDRAEPAIDFIGFREAVFRPFLEQLFQPAYARGRFGES
jgi:hypothetical protein